MAAKLAKMAKTAALSIDRRILQGKGKGKGKGKAEGAKGAKPAELLDDSMDGMA